MGRVCWRGVEAFSLCLCSDEGGVWSFDRCGLFLFPPVEIMSYFFEKVPPPLGFWFFLRRTGFPAIIRSLMLLRTIWSFLRLTAQTCFWCCQRQKVFSGGLIKKNVPDALIKKQIAEASQQRKKSEECLSTKTVFDPCLQGPPRKAENGSFGLGRECHTPKSAVVAIPVRAGGQVRIFFCPLDGNARRGTDGAAEGLVQGYLAHEKHPPP